MPPRVLRRSADATLTYHPEGKIVHHEFHRPVQGAAFREILLEGVAIFESQSAQKWLSDDRGNGALHPDDSTWAIEQWSPRVVKAGWRFWAIVLPDAALGKLNMKRFINLYRDLGVTVQIFDDPGEALGWLKRAK